MTDLFLTARGKFCSGWFDPGLTLAQEAGSTRAGFPGVLTTDFKVCWGIAGAYLAAGLHTCFRGFQDIPTPVQAGFLDTGHGARRVLVLRGHLLTPL